MYETIFKLLTSPVYKSKLDRVIDVTSAFLKDPDKESFYKNAGEQPDPLVLGQFTIFDMFAKYSEADSFDVLQYKMRRNMTIGSLTATGGQVPSSKGGELLAVEGKMAKITLGKVFDEEDMKTHYKLQNAAQIPDSYLDYLFGSIKDLETKVFKLGNVFTAQVWHMGKIMFTDPRTNVALNVTYDTWSQLFPNSLTGGATWDNHDTANGVQNLIDHSNAYYEVNGVYPYAYVMDRVNFQHLCSQRATANFAASLGMINNNPNSGSTLPTRVSKKIIDQMSEDLPEFPKIIVWDAKYELEITPNESIAFPYIPSHTVAALNFGAVERLWGLTMESALGQNAGFGSRNAQRKKPKGGIFVYSNELTSISPPMTRSFAAGTMIPWVEDSKRIGALKVLAG